MIQYRLKNYHVLEQIGQGSFGKVYKGRIKNSSQIVALKFIPKKNKSEKDINTLKQQIEILRKLKHQNIVLLIDSFQTNQHFIVVTQLAHGQLYDIIQSDKSLPENQVRKIAQQIIKALHYMHSNRIIHRDIKPHNILIAANGTIKLCDFGFARHLGYNMQVLTSIKGTPLYMAPQLCHSLPYNHTADLWSLGIILYELYLGYPPYYSSTWVQLFQTIKKQPLKIPQNINNDFKDLIKGLLNKIPGERLGWPDLLNHPFIKQSEEQKNTRIKQLQRYNSWVGDKSRVSQRSRTPINKTCLGFDSHKSRDISPRKIACLDEVWNKYQNQARQEKNITILRSDAVFLKNFLNKDQKITVQQALKTFLLMLLFKKKQGNIQNDIVYNPQIPIKLMELLKLIIQEPISQYDIISDLIKTIGLLIKSTFDKRIGIQYNYLINLMPILVTLMQTGKSKQHICMIINVIKTMGLLANNASMSLQNSNNFYNQIQIFQFIQKSIVMLKDSNFQINKYIVQFLSVIVHPIYGQIYGFFNNFKGDTLFFEQIRKHTATHLLKIQFVYFLSPVKYSSQNLQYQ